MFFNSVISRIVLSFKFSNILNPTESLVESWKLLVQIWISWFVLVDIGILIYITGLNPVQIRIPICTSRIPDPTGFQFVLQHIQLHTLYQNYGLNASVHGACPWFYWKSL